MNMKRKFDNLGDSFIFNKEIDRQKLLGIFTYKVQIFSLISILYRVYFYSYGWIIVYIFLWDFFFSAYFINHVFFFSLFLCYFFLFILFCVFRSSWLVSSKLVDNFKKYGQRLVLPMLVASLIGFCFSPFVFLF